MAAKAKLVVGHLVFFDECRMHPSRWPTTETCMTRSARVVQLTVSESKRARAEHCGCNGSTQRDRQQSDADDRYPTGDCAAHRPDAAFGLAFGNGTAALAIRFRSVLATSPKKLGAGTFPTSIFIAYRATFIGSPTTSVLVRTDLTRFPVPRPAADPVLGNPVIRAAFIVELL